MAAGYYPNLEPMTVMKNKQGFCYEIFKNQAFWSHNDTTAYNPCSFFDGFIDTNISPDKAWFGENHKKIIQLVEADKNIPGCHRCYSQESLGRESRRQGAKKDYEEFFKDPVRDGQSSDDFSLGPVSLDYSVGNLCNLKCVICGPHNSSSWITDYQKMHPGKDISKYLYRKSQKVEIENDEYLQNIKRVHFHGGGEPLMSDSHVNLLLEIKKIKGLSDVRVFYNTNGTCTVPQEVLDIWAECKLVELYFSIDDIGSRFDYQRTGASWHGLLQNLNWFREYMPHNHMFKVNCVWSYLNLYYLDELYYWHQNNFQSNRYGDICQLIFQKAIGPFEVTHLSQTAFDRLIDKFKNIDPLLSLLNGIEISDRPCDDFWKSVSPIDAIRGNSFQKICPEWSVYL